MDLIAFVFGDEGRNVKRLSVSKTIFSGKGCPADKTVEYNMGDISVHYLSPEPPLRHGEGDWG
jgi:hypothetical protein